MKIAIIFGASSFEHEISIVSAITMKKILKKHETVFIFVDSSRDIYMIENKNMKSSYFSSGEYKKSRKVSIAKGGFFVSGVMGNRKIDCDMVLNLIHGRDGEDGKMAALMEFYDIDFIGPRLEGSVISYNKLYTKLYASSLGIDVLPYEILTRENSAKDSIDFPLIIKPLRLGSSIGVSIVRDEKELDYALDVAFEFDDTVLIEPFVEGIREYNLAGCKTSVWEFSIVEEPHKDEFLDFDKKYMDFSRDSTLSEAVVDEVLREEMERAFRGIYDPLFLGSVIRCDFFVHEGRLILNEINPIPGSMANYLFEDFEDMLERLGRHLPRERTIGIDYAYIHSIQGAKGKAGR